MLCQLKWSGIPQMANPKVDTDRLPQSQRLGGPQLLWWPWRWWYESPTSEKKYGKRELRQDRVRTRGFISLPHNKCNCHLHSHGSPSFPWYIIDNALVAAPMPVCYYLLYKHGDSPQICVLPLGLGNHASSIYCRAAFSFLNFSTLVNHAIFGSALNGLIRKHMSISFNLLYHINSVCRLPYYC